MHLLTDRQDDLEKMLKANEDAFATDERQIGTTPLIKMEIDTGDHPPIAKKPNTLALKHMTESRRKLINSLRQE